MTAMWIALVFASLPALYWAGLWGCYGLVCLVEWVEERVER